MQNLFIRLSLVPIRRAMDCVKKNDCKIVTGLRWKYRRKIITGCLSVAMLLLFALQGSSLADYQILISDDFEDYNLDKWTGKKYGAHHGVITIDPLRPGNHALSFFGLNNGGDMFSIPEVELQVGTTYVFSVDYLGMAVGNSIPDNYGGFAGISDVVDDPYSKGVWFFGSQEGYPGQTAHLIDDGKWRTYSHTFVWERLGASLNNDTMHIYLEDWISSGPSIGDVYFDNVQLAMVPEPSTVALLGMAAIGLAITRTKKSFSE